MITIKKPLLFALALVMLLGLAACDRGGEPVASVADLTPYTPATEGTSTAVDLDTYLADQGTVNVGSLKGPTTMGLVNLMKKAENGNTTDTYAFTMKVAADELAADLVAGNLDIALIPANLASVLYKKTEGGIVVIDINTLGVLTCVTGDENIHSVLDLAGKTVVLTGQGTTPEYVLRYLLEQYGVTDCTLDFRAEATEVAALLAEDPTLIAVLPQPFATVAQVQNEALGVAFTLTDAWAAVEKNSQLLTGVTVVRRAFLEEHEPSVQRFLAEHVLSTYLAGDKPADTAALVAEYGIIEKAPIAEKALPYCGVTCITGNAMQEALSGYLEVLYSLDPASVGGQLPDDAFYYFG